MTEEQLVSIAAMQLTEEDTQAWMDEQGLNVEDGLPGESRDPDARATRRAEGGGERGSMTEQEREAMMATARARGGTESGGQGGAGGGSEGAAGGLGRTRLLIRDPWSNC